MNRILPVWLFITFSNLPEISVGAGLRPGPIREDYGIREMGYLGGNQRDIVGYLKKKFREIELA